MARLLLAGYFGCGNLGDDAILLGFHRALEGSSHTTRTLAGNVEGLMRNYGIQGVPRMDPRSVAEAIDEADALVFPGGSIFQDASSVRSVGYYSRLVKMAKAKGKRVVMLGQGVGPLTSFLGKGMARAAFNAADAIAVRDTASVNTLKSLGVKATPRLAGDFAYLLPKPVANEEASASFGVAGMRAIGVSARPFGKGKQMIDLFGELCRVLYQNKFLPVMLEMDQVADRQLILEIAKTQGGKVPDIKGLTSPVQIQQRVGRMEAVIAMRLHAGILAATVGVPPFMLSYDPKVTAFANAMGFSSPPNMQGITAARIMEGFQAFLKDRDRIAASLPKKVDEQAKLARVNLDVLASALG